MSRLSDIVAAFTTELADSTVTVGIGRVELSRNVAPPRVVFVPVGGPIEMTREIGRQDIAGTDATRALYQRNLTVEAHCWGSDFGATEDLAHNVIVAMRRACLGSLLLGSESWPSQEAGTASDVNLGDECVVEMGLQIPVIDALQTLAVAPLDYTVRTSSFGDDAVAAGCGD